MPPPSPSWPLAAEKQVFNDLEQNIPDQPGITAARADRQVVVGLLQALSGLVGGTILVAARASRRSCRAARLEVPGGRRMPWDSACAASTCSRGRYDFEWVILSEFVCLSRVLSGLAVVPDRTVVRL